MTMANDIRSKYLSRRTVKGIIYRMKRTALLASETPRLLSPVKAIPEIRHLPFSISRSIGNVIDNRQVDRKLRLKFFSDKLVVVLTLPSPEANISGACVSHILAGPGNDPLSGLDTSQQFEENRHPGYMLNNADADLRPEMVHDFPRGGVVDSHASATGKNLRVLDLLKIKYVVVLSHPEHQLVAAIHKYLYSSAKPYAGNAGKFILDTVFPLEKHAFNCNRPLNDNLEYLVSGGYLGSVLSWMSDWLQFRDAERSLVIKQEDLKTDRSDCLNRICQFLHGTNLDERGLSVGTDLVQQHADGLRRVQTERKHEGNHWGYYSNENSASYKRVVTEFLQLQPNRKSLLELYPNLSQVSNQGSSG